MLVKWKELFDINLLNYFKWNDVAIYCYTLFDAVQKEMFWIYSLGSDVIFEYNVQKCN